MTDAVVKMNHPIEIRQQNSLLGIVAQTQQLLTICYPKPPQDVFPRLVEQYRVGFPVYTAVSQQAGLVGFAYLAPNSKGGTLESLSVHPQFRGLGLGKQLVQNVLSDHPGVIQITTRIPDFFEELSFTRVTELPDHSHFMICVNF